MINEIAPTIIEGVKAGLNDGEWVYQVYRAVWKGRTEARQQEKTGKQAADENKNS